MGKLNKNKDALTTKKPKATVSTLEITIPANWNDKIFDKRDFKKGYNDYFKILLDTATLCGTELKCRSLLRASKEYASIVMCCTRYGCARSYKIIVPRKREKGEPTTCVVIVTGEINHSHLKVAKKRMSTEFQLANSIKFKQPPPKRSKLVPANRSKLKLVKGSKLEWASNSKFPTSLKEYSFLRGKTRRPKKRKPPSRVSIIDESVIVAHLDCRKLNYKSEIVYNYTLAVKFQQNEIFPLAERISSQHDEALIYNWLYKFREMCEVKNCWPPFNVIIADFDATTMSAITRAFNSCTLTEYLNLMHAVVAQRGACGGRGVHQSFEKIIILKCGRMSFQQNIAESIARNVPSAHAEQCIRKMVSCLYEETSYERVKTWFRDFSMLLLSKASDDQTQKIKQRICAAIMGMVDSQDMQSLEQQLAPMSACKSVECEDLCEGNLFSKDFNTIYMKSLRARPTKNNRQMDKNVFHCEEFLKVFKLSFALYVPLWTALIFKERQNNGNISNMLFVDAFLLGHAKVRIGYALRMLKSKATWLYDNGGLSRENAVVPASQGPSQTRDIALQTSLNALQCIASTMENSIAKANASVAAAILANAKAATSNFSIPNLAIPCLASTCLAIPNTSNTCLSFSSLENLRFVNTNFGNKNFNYKNLPNSNFANISLSNSPNFRLTTGCENTMSAANPNCDTFVNAITNWTSSPHKQKSTFILKRKLSSNLSKSNFLLSVVDAEDKIDLWKSMNFTFPRLKAVISPALDEPIDYYVVRTENVVLKYFDFNILLSAPQKMGKNKNLYLHDKHIDFFTTIFARSAKIDGFQIFESYIGEHYIWSQLQNHDERSQLELMRNYPALNYIKESVVFIPICHKSHWCLAIAYFDTLQLVFYDPMVKTSTRTERIAIEFRRAFAKFLDLYNRIVMKNLFPVRTGVWRIIPIVYSQCQQDNYNCGCFVLNCIEERLNLRPPNHRYQPMQYRKYLALSALEFGDPYDFTLNPNKHHYCLYCAKEIKLSSDADAGAADADDVNVEDDLPQLTTVCLSCNFCSYWVHVDCASKHHNVNPDYRWRNDFVCLLCER